MLYQRMLRQLLVIATDWAAVWCCCPCCCCSCGTPVDDDVPEALFNELALTVLQQSTLCPLPLAVQPVHWAHEQVGQGLGP